MSDIVTVRNDGLNLFWYVIISQKEVDRLNKAMDVEFRFYRGAISVFRVERNAKIRCDSLCMRINDSISTSQRDMFYNYVRGWLDALDVKNSHTQMALRPPAE